MIEIRKSKKSGGKAGAGRNKTASIQIVEPMPGGAYLMLAQCRYTVGDESSEIRAMGRAEAKRASIIEQRIHGIGEP